MNATRKALCRKADRNGVVHALVSDGVSFEVWVLRENYDGSCRGGSRKTWRYIEKDLSETEARNLFERRTK